MIERSISIVPLNSGFGTDMGSLLTFDAAAHGASGAPSVLCAGPMTSYFRMKSASDAPVLEPAVFGLAPGDEILLEFEAVLISGTVDNLQARFTSIIGGSASGVGVTQTLPPAALTGYFKPFRIPFVVREEFEAGEGVLVVIGFEDPWAEVALRDVVIRVRSRDARLGLRDRIVALTTQPDYVKNVSLVQRSPIHPGFHTARRLLRDGAIRFPDLGTAAIAWPEEVEQWAGFASYLPACRYPQPVHVYYEVWDPVGSPVTVSERMCPVGLDYAETGAERTHTGNTPTNGSWRARFRVFRGVPGDKRLVRVDVGAVASGAETRIRNVHFSLPRFDDKPDDRRPDQLDEIYPDLSAILSP
jgi:hypothetical protein